VNNKLTDTQIIEAIKRVFATEQCDTDAVRKVRQILAPPAPADGLPEYDFETATEAERWAYDQGYEAGWGARLNPKEMTMAGVKEAIASIVMYFNQVIDGQQP
jgi:hypothetical protein